MIKQKIDNFTKSQEEGLSKLEAFLSTKIDINDINTRVFLLMGKAGSGKAQPVSSKIQTPFGEKELKDLEVNDVVYTKDGTYTSVIGIFPQGQRDVYKITFNDGTHTYSDIEHIWNVRRTSGNSKKAGFKNKTLKEILEKGIIQNSNRDKQRGNKGASKWEIPICEPVENFEKEFPIDPYLLGVLIGDGSLTKSCALISNPIKDYEIIENIKPYLTNEGYSVKMVNRTSKDVCPQYMITISNKENDGFINRIKALNLNVNSKEKFIPKEYFLGNVYQRFELLKGLMDTDGSSSKKRMRFSTSSEKLANDVCYLIRSLGGVCYLKKNNRDEFNISFNIGYNPFKLKRKADNYIKRNLTKTIRDVSFYSKEECVCIMVENDSHLYLTNDFIVTHNTTIIRYALEKLLEKDKQNINPHEIFFDMFNLPNVFGITQSHKAKNVLMQSLWACGTFASAFDLKEKIDQATGKRTFERTGKFISDKAVCRYPIKVFVHDECSMYSQQMLDYVLKDTNYSGKIIFMGDPGQIPPIDEGFPDRDSPVFDLDLNESNKHTLIERVRQTAGNPILELSDIIYEEIFGNQNMERVLNALNVENYSDGKGIKHVKASNFLEEYKAISDNYLDTKVVAYRNETVRGFNENIRKFIHNKPDQKYIAHEIIYLNDSFYHEEKPKFMCYNSQEFIIENVVEKVIKGYKSLILHVDDKRFLPVIHPSEQSRYENELSRMAYFAKQEQNPKYRGKKWAAFYDFKKQWADVSYGYCFTGHKIQGSGYKNIFVDISDILSVGPISDKRKLQSIYTAITRATDLVILIKRNGK